MNRGGQLERLTRFFIPPIRAKTSAAADRRGMVNFPLCESG